MERRDLMPHVMQEPPGECKRAVPQAIDTCLYGSWTVQAATGRGAWGDASSRLLNMHESLHSVRQVIGGCGNRAC